jgi:transcriptional regulator with XRE-family HTH domain
MFVENVERLARERNMSLSGVANALGMTNNSATKWRKGAVPNSKNLYKLAEYFGVTVDYLLSDNPPPTISVTGGITGHNVVNGTAGGQISISNGNDLNEVELELLRIFRALDMKGKTAVLSAAYEQEELQK